METVSGSVIRERLGDTRAHLLRRFSSSFRPKPHATRQISSYLRFRSELFFANIDEDRYEERVKRFAKKLFSGQLDINQCSMR